MSTIIDPCLEADHSFRNRRYCAIAPTLQVMVAFQFLSPLSDSFGISKSSSSRIIRRFVKVMVKRATRYIFFDAENLERVSSPFHSVAGFPIDSNWVIGNGMC